MSVPPAFTDIAKPSNDVSLLSTNNPHGLRESFADEPLHCSLLPRTFSTRQLVIETRRKRRRHPFALIDKRSKP